MNPDYKPDKNTRQEIEKLHDEGISLSGIYLKYADMKNTKLVNVDFSGADLTRADFSGASMYGANLEGANLFKANFERANLNSANLKKCDLLGVDFSNTKLNNVDWGEDHKIINEQQAEAAIKEGNTEKAKEKYRESEDIYRALKISLKTQTLGDDVGKFFEREMIARRKQMSKYSPLRIISKLAHLTIGYGEKIGNILVHNGSISEENLNKALADQSNTNDKLGNILIKLGYISDDDLTRAYSEQMGHKAIDLEEIVKANLEVTSLLSEEFAKEKKIIALNKSDDSIVIAMEDPEDLSTLDAVKKLTNLNPQIFISSKSDLDKGLEILYDKIKKSGEVESAISNISIIKGDEEDSDELDLATESSSSPFMMLILDIALSTSPLFLILSYKISRPLSRSDLLDMKI
jgi:hypothetical protein